MWNKQIKIPLLSPFLLCFFFLSLSLSFLGEGEGFLPAPCSPLADETLLSVVLVKYGFLLVVLCKYCALQVTCLGGVGKWHLSMSLYKLTASVSGSITKLST